MAAPYRVKPNETFSIIADRFGLPWQDLVNRFNPGFKDNPHSLPVGTTIMVPDIDEAAETVQTDFTEEQLQADQDPDLTFGDDEIGLQIQNVVSDKSVPIDAGADSPVAMRTRLDSEADLTGAEQMSRPQAQAQEVTPTVPLTTEMAYKDGEFQVDDPKGFTKITDVQKQVTEKEQDLTKISNLLGQQRAINQELAQFGIDIEEKETAASLQAIQQMQAQEEDYRLAREERVKLQKQRVQQLMNQVTAATNEYKSARVDPERFFNKKGTGAKILAALAAGLGAYAAAMTGTRNFALEVIDQAISDDIEAQKAEIAQKGTVITERRNLLNDLINQGMTDAEAESAARVIMLNKIQLDLDQKVALTKNEAVKQKGKILKTQLQTEADLAIERLKLDAAPTKVTIKTEKMVKAPKTSAAILQETADKAEATALGKEKAKRKITAQGPSDKEIRELSVPGYMNLAPDPARAKKAQEQVAETKVLLKALDRLVEIREEYGAEIYNRKIIAEGKRLSAQVAVIIKSPEFFNLGVLSGPDLEIIERIVPADATAIEFGVEDAYRDARNYVKLKLDSTMEAYGLIPEEGLIDMNKIKNTDMRNRIKASQATYE
jgi:hypothetical protein